MISASRKGTLVTILIVGAVLAAVFAAVAAVSPPNTFLSFAGHALAMAAGAFGLAGVVLVLVQEITRRVARH